jgi:hypothetical protein
METERLEKEFQLWNRFMFLVLGSSITLVIIGFTFILNRDRWQGFANYMGGIWIWVQLLATTPAFILLLVKRWRTIPLVDRLNTIFGYFLASWLSFLAFGLIADGVPNELYFLLVGYALLIVGGYIWSLKRTSIPRDEMFP